MRNLLSLYGFEYHSHFHTIDDIPQPSRVVVSVREPVDRFVSLYSLMVNAGNDVIPSIQDFIDDKEKFKQDVGYERWGFLYNPQTFWIGSAFGRSGQLIVLRTESLAKDVNERLGIEFDTKKPQSKKVKIDDAQRDALMRIFSEDYDLLDRLARES